MTDLLLIIGLTLGACLVVGLLGALLLRSIRRSSLRYQLAVASLIPVLAVAATVVINVELMFLSAHDTTVILIAVGTALVVAVVGGWLVSRRFSLASRHLQERIGLLVSDSQGVRASDVQEHDSDGNDRGLPAELARVEEDAVGPGGADHDHHLSAGEQVVPQVDAGRGTDHEGLRDGG